MRDGKERISRQRGLNKRTRRHHIHFSQRTRRSEGEGRVGDNAGSLGQSLKGHEHSAADFRLVLGGQYEPQKISEQRKDRTEAKLEEWPSDPTVLGSGGGGRGETLGVWLRGRKC